MDRHADDAFDRSHRSEVDDRDSTLCATSEKLKPGALSTRGGPRSSSAQ